jgi:hypothetical protein
MCRAHAVQARINGGEIRLPKDSPLFNILEIADRAFAKSNNDFAKQVGNLFGEFLAGGTNQANARRIPPKRPPEPVKAKEDPRVILGFEPGESLTRDVVKARKRALAGLFHPDKPGGSVSAMKRVNEAADTLLKSL